MVHFSIQIHKNPLKIWWLTIVALRCSEMSKTRVNADTKKSITIIDGERMSYDKKLEFLLLHCSSKHFGGSIWIRKLCGPRVNLKIIYFHLFGIVGTKDEIYSLLFLGRVAQNNFIMIRKCLGESLVDIFYCSIWKSRWLLKVHWFSPK
jgi:hypothetical protein